MTEAQKKKLEEALDMIAAGIDILENDEGIIETFRYEIRQLEDMVTRFECAIEEA